MTKNQMTKNPDIIKTKEFQEFSEEIIAEADAISLTDEIFENRRQVEGITIDGEHSMDLDDAIHVTKKAQGYLVTVSVSDVASLIQPDSYIDKEALARITTKYLSYGVRPMIPQILSEGFLSLHQGKVRPTLSVSFLISPQYKILGQSVDKTFIKSVKKMSYPSADQILSADPQDPNYEILCILDDITRNTSAQRLTAKKRKDFNRHGQRIFIDENGVTHQPDDENPYNSNLIIQELMISANAAIAEILNQNKIPTLYRNHKKRRWNANTPNKASYGAEAQGHSTLGLTAYTHATSPIRRYPDIIVQRSLHSLIEGTAPVYGKTKLIAIADYINKRQEESDKERTEYLREKSYNWAKKQIMEADAEDYISMDPREFLQVVKAACAENSMSAIMADGIQRRLAKGKIRDIDIYYILFESQQGHPIWNFVRESMVSTCIHNSGVAMQILEFARSRKSGWSGLQNGIKETPTGYLAGYTISIDGKDINIEAFGRHAKYAKEQAAKALLCEYFGIQMPESLKKSVSR